MYLFSRRARLATLDAFEWAVNITGAAGAALGSPVELWGNTLSPAFGTVSWTSWWPDLTSLEAGLAKLGADGAYNELAAQGSDLIEGVVDDTLYSTVSGGPAAPGEPGADGGPQYVNGVTAVCAGGNLARAMTAGVEIATRAEAITGVPTMFVRQMTGAYSGVAWLTGFPDLGAYESSMDKLASDPGWLTLLDSTDGCFVEDAALTQSTVYGKLA